MSTIRLYYGRDSGEMIRKIEEALVDDNRPVVSAIEVRETVLEDDVIEAIVKLISSGSIESIQLDDCGAYLNKSAVQMARALGACKHVRLSEPTFLTKFFLECFLVSATKLQSLRIQDRLLVEQVEALSNGLRSNNTLHTLDLSRSRIDDFSVLAEGLRGSCVKGIKLRSIGLRDTHVTTMMTSLESCPALESLDLSFNHIRNLTTLGKFLRCADCNLRELSIGYQNVWQSPNIDIGELAEALKVNKTLITLKLPRNKLIDSDAIIISMALMENSTLENLDVRENNFSDIGIIHLAKTARDNSKGLRKIYTSNNPFGKSGSLALLEAAATNFDLIHIDTNCKDDDRINKQIRYHIALNRGGRKLLLENPPLAIWPLAMERSQIHLEEYYANNSNNNNIIDDDDDDMDLETSSCDINMRSDVLYYLLKENPSTFFF
ncbi:MAG: Ran GTPase-activating protein (RanGAP) involved in mRNA processing and transport [Bacillariaceae sp.]|jgi:Ran GTPase-activating protein (RanGAP) involved in mRNA processing and transport